MINRVLLFACFLSGTASLFYEVLWTRAFSLILGSTTQAAALIFAAFLTGLALGAWLFGELSGRLRNPLRAYLWLEVGIAIVAVATGLTLHHQADAIGAMLGSGATRHWMAFVLAVLMILPPTLLMGGTLPLLLTIVQRQDSHLSIVGRFYGWNTFGAATGTLLCGFFAIRLLGVSDSYYLAMSLNLLVAAMCLVLLRRQKPQLAATAEQANESVTERMSVYASEAYLLLIAVSSGAVVLSLEMIWVRFAGFFLGNRTYAFSMLMFVVLMSLAAGSWLSARVYSASQQQPGANPYRTFAHLLTLGALAVVFSAAGGWWLIANQSALESRLPNLQQWILLYRFLEAFVLLAPPLIFLGALLPLSMAFSKHCAANIGHTSARYYVINAVGVVVGSLGTVFVGINWLGSFGMFRLLVIVLFALAVCSLYRAGRPASRYSIAAGSAALLAVFMLPGLFPSALGPGERLLVEQEDEYGVFRATALANGNIRVTNNRSDLIFHLGAHTTDYVQQMQGHIGVHFNPGAKDALVIGSGYGITAGAIGSYDTIEHVDAVEILPALVAAADFFTPNNFFYHQNPKVRVLVDDGRHFLVRQDKQYDIISLNLSDPHLPGGATLFHREFYELVKQHLKPGGVMIQHAFGSERAIIANTLAASFPHLLFSKSYGNGYNVVASLEPLAAAAGRLMVLPEEAMKILKQGRQGIPMRMPVHRRYEDLPPDMHSEIVATDDFPAVEFSWNPGVQALFINE